MVLKVVESGGYWSKVVEMNATLQMKLPNKRQVIVSNVYG